MRVVEGLHPNPTSTIEASQQDLGRVARRQSFLLRHAEDQRKHIRGED
jgi:hypothetical protein